jgi:hypothetical protein
MIKIEAVPEKAKCQEEESDTTLCVNNVPLACPLQLIEGGNACNIEVAKSTEPDYTPTYEEMTDRASPWYRPPHARPKRHAQTSSTARGSLDIDESLTRSIWGNTRSGASTTKNIESETYPPRSSVSILVPVPYSNTQEERQAQGRGGDIIRDLENKMGLDSVVSNASSSDVSSDSGIIVTTLSTEREGKDVVFSISHPIMDNSAPVQREIAFGYANLNVKNEDIAPTTAPSKALPHMRGFCATTPTTLSSINSSATNASAQEQMTGSLAASCNTTNRTSLGESQTMYVLPHMRDSGSSDQNNLQSSSVEMDYTPSLSSVSTSNGGALVQETLVTAQQPSPQQHTAVFAPDITLEPIQEEISDGKPTDPKSDRGSTALPQGYLATEDAFLKAVAARSKQLTTTHRADTPKAPEYAGISSRYANASLNQDWMNTTDANSFLAAVKSKEHSQPVAAKHYYHQQSQNTRNIPTEGMVATTTNKASRQKSSTPVTVNSPAVEKACATKIVGHEAQTQQTPEQNQILVESKVSCEAVILDNSEARTVRLEQVNTACKDPNFLTKQQNESTVAHRDSHTTSPLQKASYFTKKVLSELEESQKLLQNNNPLTRISLERVTSCAPRSSTSSVQASEGNVSHFMVDKNVPKEGVRSEQGEPAHRELLDWNSNWNPPPCDWETDRAKFNSSSFLPEYILEWCMQPSYTPIDMTSKLFTSGSNIDGSNPTMPYPNVHFKFTLPPEDVVSLPGKHMRCLYFCCCHVNIRQMKSTAKITRNG